MRIALRTLAVVMLLVGALAFAGPASAEHDHWLETPGTLIGDIGSGQTAISDSEHGGYHRFHNNVHTGTAGQTLNAKTPVSIGRY